ncbi:MAG: DNA repair protein RecN, partial [Planctomycetes bacterium]|nr:DNA repair protein RecN [Planctomycetota bacterium]
MLHQLEIFNLATFKELRIEFSEGLNIVSGMSGAGKSILLKALELCLGGRFSQKLIQEEAPHAEVRGLFTLPDHLLNSWQEDLSLSSDEVIIRRVFKKEGRSMTYINDRMVSTDLLKRLGDDLAKTLSQDEALGLRDQNYQLMLLDVFAEQEKNLDKYSKRYGEMLSLQNKIKELQQQESAWAQERQFLEFQHGELSKLDLQAGEYESLEEEHKMLAHGHELKMACSTLGEAASEFTNTLMNHLEALKDFSEKGSELASLAAEGESLQYSSEEWARLISAQGSSIDLDPQRLSEVEERISSLRAAFKKFSLDEEGLLLKFQELEIKLHGEAPQTLLIQTQEKMAELQSECKKLAETLHKKRVTSANKLSREINQSLASLEMEGNRFSIALNKKEELGEKGLTLCEFQLKATADSPLKPLHDSASGGERSRALLSISSALAGAMSCPLLVFDEIDTNIGSRLGAPVAEAFLKLSLNNQVICVTHLAPVAAGGKRHLLVEKGRRYSTIRHLTADERVAELAHMIAGEKDSPSALEQAKHMIDR